MTLEAKKEAISNKVNELLTESYKDAEKMINKAIDSGCLDIENWDSEINNWILPKAITIAILEKESNDYRAKGTSFEKQISKEVKNLSYFL